MTKLGLSPYHTDGDPVSRSVPVTVIVLTLNEEPNIERCLASVAWAAQVVVVDSGSSDQTLLIAKALGAEIVEQPWLGFSAQRDFALRLPNLRHNWAYFVDADQWISPELAREVSDVLRAPTHAAFTQRCRLVWQDTWIRHCGWYKSSWNVQLMDRRRARYNGSLIAERVEVDGQIGRLKNDIVDQDLKHFSTWLHKHVHYAELEAAQRTRTNSQSLAKRLHAVRGRRSVQPWPLAILKDVIWPTVPLKPLALLMYMYLIRLGWLDGPQGLRFCLFHAWHEACVGALLRPRQHISEIK